MVTWYVLLSLLLVHASLDCGCSVLALDSVFAFNFPIGSNSYCAEMLLVVSQVWSFHRFGRFAAVSANSVEVHCAVS